jgi:hypothetical protein
MTTGNSGGGGGGGGSANQAARRNVAMAQVDVAHTVYTQRQRTFFIPHLANHLLCNN